MISVREWEHEARRYTEELERTQEQKLCSTWSEAEPDGPKGARLQLLSTQQDLTPQAQVQGSTTKGSSNHWIVF